MSIYSRLLNICFLNKNVCHLINAEFLLYTIYITVLHSSEYKNKISMAKYYVNNLLSYFILNKIIVN